MFFCVCRSPGRERRAIAPGFWNEGEARRDPANRLRISGVREGEKRVCLSVCFYLSEEVFRSLTSSGKSRRALVSTLQDRAVYQPAEPGQRREAEEAFLPTPRNLFLWGVCVCVYWFSDSFSLGREPRAVDAFPASSLQFCGRLLPARPKGEIILLLSWLARRGPFPSTSGLCSRRYRGTCCCSSSLGFGRLEETSFPPSKIRAGVQPSSVPPAPLRAQLVQGLSLLLSRCFWARRNKGYYRSTSGPPNLIYDQLRVCLILPWAQIREQAIFQNMPEGRDGQRRRVRQDHDQRGGHPA